MPAEPSLDHFTKFFRDRLEFVRGTCLDRIEGRILLCSYLDSLAGYRYGGTSSGSRLRKFLLEDTDQANTWRNVSLILLRQYLAGKDQGVYSKLIAVLNRLGAITSNYQNLDYNPDVPIEELLCECRKSLSSQELKMLGADIKRFEYTAILWNAYRNASVHETCVQLDDVPNLAQSVDPFYTHVNHMSSGSIVTKRTHFNIPPLFLVATCESALIRLEKLVSEGNCVISISAPYDSPSRQQETPETESASDSTGFPRLITKPFRSLHRDFGYLLDQAKQSHALFAESDDGEDRWREGAVSRSCIIFCIFFLESIVNSIVADFPQIEPYQLPERLLKKSGLRLQPFERLKLIDKVFLVPYLCCDDEDSLTKEFFKRGSKEFQALKELIEIRDSFAHSRPVKRKLEFTETGEKEWVADDQFKENFWPQTGIPKDICIIDVTHARRAKNIVDSTVLQLDKFLGGRLVRDNWMTHERIELKPTDGK